MFACLATFMFFFVVVIFCALLINKWQRTKRNIFFIKIEENVAFLFYYVTVIVKHFSHQLHQVFHLHFKQLPQHSLEFLTNTYAQNIVIYMKIYTIILVIISFSHAFHCFSSNHCLMERVANSGYDI